MNLILFFVGQLILCFSSYKTYRLLRSRGLLSTPLALVVLSTYLYLFVYYGPTNIFAALGPVYLPMAKSHPWFYEPSTITTSFAAGILQQLFPYIFTLLVLHGPNKPREIVSVRLDQVFGHSSNYCFGLAGTCIQALLALLSPLWKQGVFVFNTSFLPLQLTTSSFLLVTFAPQFSLIVYSIFRKKNDLNLAPWQINLATICSLIVAAIAFSAYSFRTYSILNAGLAVAFILVALPPARRTIVTATSLFTVFAVGAYLVTTLTSRLNINSEHIIPHVARSLQRELSYRSGFGTDSSVTANLQCINTYLDSKRMRRPDLLLIELATGLPRPLRNTLYPNLMSNRLESIMKYCYANKLGNMQLHLDLLDTKNEYFIVLNSSPYLAALTGSLFWAVASLSIIVAILKLHPFFSFGVAASIQILTFSSTPGELVSVLKILILYSPLVLCFLAGFRKWAYKNRVV